MLCGMGEAYKTDHLHYIEELITLYYIRTNLNYSGEDTDFIDEMGKKILAENIDSGNKLFQKAWDDKWKHYIKSDDSLQKVKDWCDILRKW